MRARAAGCSMGRWVGARAGKVPPFSFFYTLPRRHLGVLWMGRQVPPFSWSLVLGALCPAYAWPGRVNSRSDSTNRALLQGGRRGRLPAQGGPASREGQGAPRLASAAAALFKRCAARMPLPSWPSRWSPRRCRCGRKNAPTCCAAKPKCLSSTHRAGCRPGLTAQPGRRAGRQPCLRLYSAVCCALACAACSLPLLVPSLFLEPSVGQHAE